MVRLYYNEDTEDKIEQLLKVSNPKQVITNAINYFNDTDIKVYVSPYKNKKYAIYNPNTNALVSFGDIRFQDYTHHQNDVRRNNYLRRASNIKGSWKDDKYSSNNLSIHLLWS
jgi:hypothetical protein